MTRSGTRSNLPTDRPDEPLRRDLHTRSDCTARNRSALGELVIKRFRILDRDLTEDDGELTPTVKVNVVYGKYADFFVDIYREA